MIQAVIIAAVTALCGMVLAIIAGAAEAIYKAGKQQRAEDEGRHLGYYQKHPYIDAQKVILKHAGERLKYWLFVRGKGCNSCCLRCAHYRKCRDEIESERWKSAKRKDRPRKRGTRGAI